MAMRLGPLPQKLFEKWPARENFYAPDGTLLRTYKGEDASELFVMVSMEKCIQNLELPVLDEVGKRHVSELLRLKLDYDPAKRPSAETLREHAWFHHTPRWIPRKSKFEKHADEKRRRYAEEQARIREEEQSKKKLRRFRHANRCLKRDNMIEAMSRVYSAPTIGSWLQPLWHAGRWNVTLRKGPGSRPRIWTLDGTRKCWGGRPRWKFKQNDRLLRCRGQVSLYSDPSWSVKLES
jgi:serine/threonine protein kinase